MSARPAPVPGLLARQWQDFARLIPAGAPEHVRRGFRKCFMCGAVAMLDILSAELDPEKGEAQRDEAVLDVLRAELTAFMQETMLAASPAAEQRSELRSNCATQRDRGAFAAGPGGKPFGFPRAGRA